MVTVQATLAKKLDVGEKNADLNASRFAPAGRESELVPNVIVLMVPALDDAGCLVRGLQSRSSAARANHGRIKPNPAH
jgi:hypothetical protein